jgi:SAM-dependent methyltransferase
VEHPIGDDGPIEEGRSASYRMETLDADVELKRLRAQVELVRPMEDEFLAMAGFQPTDHLLDVGCGPGFFAERVADELLDGGRVTGVDVDTALLEVGRARLAGRGLPVELVAGTAVRLPLPDDSADFAYARFLFQHLTDPAVVLAEMVRVVRPGGVVALADTDDGSLVVHPEPEGFADLLVASAEAQRDRGGDRHVGRKLKWMLCEAGLTDVRGHARAFTTELVPAKAFVGLTLGFKTKVIGPPHMERGRSAAILAELERLAGTPGFFGHALGYGAWGRVPTP